MPRLSKLSKRKPPFPTIDLVRKLPVNAKIVAAHFVLFNSGLCYGINKCREWGKQSADKRYEAKQLMEKSGEV